MANFFIFNSIDKNRNIIPKDLAEPILNAILEDDSDKLAEFVSNLDDINCALLLTNKKLPEIISQLPTILSLCCFFVSIRCFNLLIDMNANPFTEDKIGRTCIHFAAAGGSLEIMRTLDQSIISEKNESNDTNGNTISSENNSDYSSDDDSNTNANKNIFLANNSFNKLFVFPNQITRPKTPSTNPYNSSDSNGLTPMHYGAMFGRLEIIHYLWTKGVKLDKYKNNQGYKPIHLACLYGHTEAVKFLNENSSKSKSKSKASSKLQPIHYACIGGHIGTIEYLVSQNVDINEMANSKTPIFYAARYGSLEAVKFLVKNGAKFKFKRRKTSPIVEASFGGHADIVNFFLQQGCDPNVYTSNGMTPLIAAIIGNNADIVKLLIKNGAKLQYGRTDRENNREENVTNYNEKTKTQLYREIVQINNFSEWECNDPLIIASRKGNIEILDPILQQIDIDRFIHDDEEISEKKKMINLSLLKLLKKEKRHKKYLFSFRDDGIQLRSNIKKRPSPINSDSCDDKSNHLNTKDENNQNNIIDNDNISSNSETNNNIDHIKENKNVNSCQHSNNSLLNFFNNHDINETTAVYDNEEEEDYSCLDDQEIYRKVVDLGHSNYSDMIENDLFFNPHFGKRYQLCLNAIKSGSTKFFELLIQNRLYPSDATELYCSASVVCCLDILKCMLKNDLPFNNTNKDLKRFVLNLGNIEILQQFLDKGLKFIYEKDIKLIPNVFRTYNPDFLAFVLDTVLIKNEEQPSKKTSVKKLNNALHSLFYNFYDFEFDSQYLDLINILLDNSFHNHRYSNLFNREADQIDRIESLNDCDPYWSRSTRRELQTKIEEKMLLMMRILLDRGHKFNPEGKMFSIPSSAHDNEIQLLFNLLKEIDSRSNQNELNFKNLQLFDLKPLFNNRFKQNKEFIEFLFAHNFSLKPKITTQYYLQKRYLEEIDRIFNNSIQIGFFQKFIKPSLNGFFSGSFLSIKQFFNDNDDDKNDSDDKNIDEENNNVDQEENEERKSHVDLVRFLLKNDTPVSNHSLRVIEKAAHLNNDLELATLAFKNYYNPDKKVENGHKTPLELACKRGYTEIVKDLVARGFDINESGFHGYASPLMFAKMSNNDELLNYLKSIDAKLPKLNQECSTKVYKMNNQHKMFSPRIFFI